MIASHTLTTCLGLATSLAVAGHASASTVNISNPNNIAGTATLSSPDGDTTFPINPLSLATDDLVSDGIPGDPQSDYTDTPHLVYNSLGANPTNELLLTFDSAVTLTELVAYVGAGDGAGGETSTFPDADRPVSSIEFFVNTGSGLSSVGTVAMRTPMTSPLGIGPRLQGCGPM